MAEASGLDNMFRLSTEMLAIEDELAAAAASPSHRISEPPSASKLPVTKSYDYTLKFLLVGDQDVGKEEILNGLEEADPDESLNKSEASYCGSPGSTLYKSTIILLDGKRIRLQLWDTSGQGRFSTIIRSYSRGAQGILLVYDITNRYSFAGLNRWLQEVAEYAPGVPKILLGNRLHLAFKRQINENVARAYAHKHNMSFFEVSPLCNYNVRESFVELSRIVLQKIGMESLFRNTTVLSLQELCCRAIVRQTTVYSIEQLPLPSSMKSNLKSFSTMNSYTLTMRPLYHQNFRHQKDHTLRPGLRRKAKALFTCDAGGSSANASGNGGSGTNSKSRPSSTKASSSAAHHDHKKSCIIS